MRRICTDVDFIHFCTAFKIPPTAVGGLFNSSLYRLSILLPNPPNGSWGMLKVQPHLSNGGWTLTIPQLPLGGLSSNNCSGLGWSLTIPQLPLGGFIKAAQLDGVSSKSRDGIFQRVENKAQFCV